MNNHGTDFLDQPLKPARRKGHRAKLELDPNVSKEEIAAAVTYLEEANAGARQLTGEVRRLSEAAQALLKSGLTERAAGLLIQDLGPKSHGRPIPLDTILHILKAAARLHEHLR